MAQCECVDKAICYAALSPAFLGRDSCRIDGPLSFVWTLSDILQEKICDVMAVRP